MKNESSNKYISAAIYGLAVIVLGAFFIMLLFSLRDYLAEKRYTAIFEVLNPFIYGAVIAYLLNPLMTLYEKKVFRRLRRGGKSTPTADAQMRRMIALVSALFSALILIGLVALMVFPQVGESANQLTTKIMDLFSPVTGTAAAEAVPDANFDALLQEMSSEEELTGYDFLRNTQLGVLVSDVSHSVQDFISNFGLKVDIEQSLRDIIFSAAAELTVLIGQYYQEILNTTASFILTTAKQLWDIVIGIIIAVYILAEKEHLFAQLKRFLYAVLPSSLVHQLVKITRTTHQTFNSFITGKVLDSLIIGVLCFICMSIFSINYSLLISVIIGITNIIPFFGPFIGAIPSILFLSVNDLGEGLWFAVFILILQQVDGNIIGPKILGSTIGISSFWVIFSILVFSALLGPVGMFIGVPVFAVIYTLMKDFTAARLAKKGLTIEISSPGGWDGAKDTIPAADVPAPSDGFFSGAVESLSKNIQAIMKKIWRRDSEDINGGE